MIGLRRVADGIEALVVVAVVQTVVLLFINDPTSPPPQPAEAAAANPGIDAAAVYGRSCAGCHGGDGSGGIGPGLSGGRVVAAFPDPADQVVVIAEGRGGMPGFAGRLTDEEIVALVEYTRVALAGS